MSEWNVEQRAFAVEMFFKTKESYVCTVRAFRKRFGIASHKPVPTEATVRLWVKNFRTKGVVTKIKPPGPVKSVRTTPNIEKVREAITKSPRRSVRKHAASLGLSERTVRRILHDDLHFHPYKMLMTQQLLTTDHATRLQFCERLLDEIESNDFPIDKVLFTDEAHFYLHGDVNTQNMRYWSSENPRIIQEKPLHSPKVTVWMGIASFDIIGPYFFEETVNGDRYRDMLATFVVPELKRRRKCSTTWFQQDGATCHTATETITLLRKHFHNRIISRGCDFPWPPRSPDLAACDFFLWGYLKSKVYINKPRDLAELKANIEEETARISASTRRKVIDNFKKRLSNCVKNGGGHLHDVIFKTT